MPSDYEKTLAVLDKSQHAYREIKDLSGNPFFIVERKKPDKCPEGRAHSYYSWGVRFAADHQFIEAWGVLPLPVRMLGIPGTPSPTIN
jgi:hypothetical protein